MIPISGSEQREHSRKRLIELIRKHWKLEIELMRRVARGEAKKARDRTDDVNQRPIEWRFPSQLIAQRTILNCRRSCFISLEISVENFDRFRRWTHGHGCVGEWLIIIRARPPPFTGFSASRRTLTSHHSAMNQCEKSSLIHKWTRRGISPKISLPHSICSWFSRDHQTSSVCFLKLQFLVMPTSGPAKSWKNSAESLKATKKKLKRGLESIFENVSRCLRQLVTQSQPFSVCETTIQHLAMEQTSQWWAWS